MVLAGLVLTLLPSSIAHANESTRAAMRGVGSATFKQFTIDDGLSQSEVGCMLLDRDGFLWLGTQDGLNRFDGYHFEVFRHDPRRPDTLSGNYVYNIKEDRSGKLWVLTNGPSLDRFDRMTGLVTAFMLPGIPGRSEPNRVISMTSSEDDTLLLTSSFDGLYRIHLSDGAIETLIEPSEFSTDLEARIPHRMVTEDASHRVWFTNASGELWRQDARHVREKVSLEHLGNIIDDSGQVGLHLGSASRDLQGNLWFTSSNGLLRWDARTDQLDNVPLPYHMMTGDRKQLPSMLKLSSSGELWIGTTDGLFSIDTDTLKITRWSCDDDIPGQHRLITDIHETRSGTLWVGTSSFGLHRLDRKLHRLIEYRDWRLSDMTFMGSPIGKIISDSADNIWVSGASRLWQVRRERDTFFNFTHGTAQPYGLSHPVVWTAMEDRGGDVWVGTYDGNLNRVQKDGTVRIYPPPPVSELQAFRRMLVKQVEEPNGTLWVGRRDGELSLLDPETGQFNAPDVDIELRDGRVITKENSHGQYVSLIPGLAIEYRKEAITGLPPIHQLYRTRLGKLMLFTEAGVWVLDDVKGRLKPVRAGGHGITLIEARINSIAEDEQGRIYMANGSEILLYDPRGNSLEMPSIGKEYTRLGGGVEVMSLHYQKGGTLWVGTLGEGLYRIDTNTGSVRLFTMADGLPNNTVYNILQDSGGQLWMSTNHGLVSINPMTLQIQVIKGDAGLQSDEFNEGAAEVGRSGYVYFGGIQGLTRFNPEKVINNPHPPNVVVTGFKRFDKSEPMSSGSDGMNAVTISHKDNYVTFEFVALDLTDPTRNRYRYRLEGFDDQWRQTHGQRYASYTNLPGGTYHFKVQAANNSGVWNEVGSQVLMTVIPPLWKTWWAYTLYALLLMALVATFIRVQQHKLARERAINEQLRRVDRLKDEFLANTSHELRTPLNGIIGIAESLVDGAMGVLPEGCISNLSMIACSGRRLSHLINDILDFSRLKNRDLLLELKPVNLQPLAEVVMTLARPLVGNKPVTLHNDLTMELPAVLGDENRLQQILHNLIGNAVKFTERGEIHIDAFQSGDMLQITVSDSGIGIPADKMEDIFKSFEQVDGSISRKYGGTGLGLAITRQLVELHGGKLWAESVLGSGSSFVMRLPIPKSSGCSFSQGAPAEARAPSQQLDLQRMTEVPRVRDEMIPGVIQLGMESGKEQRYRILVVDDEPVNLQVLVNHLSLKQYHITVASSGMEALERIADQNRFDLIILDVMMPGMSGFEVCRRIREKSLPSELPVVMLTARNQIADLVEGFNAGANDYLTKPVSKHELMVRTRMHLQLSKLNTAYSRFVPREFLEHLELESILDVQLGDHVLKEMTVLFSDIRSFTALSEQMSPEENFRFVNSYLERMEPVIRQHRGFIDKYIGDAIMALFSGTADDALRASVAMLVALEEYNRGRIRAGYDPVRIGIGLNTGNLMLGTVGGPGRMDGTVISDAVNLASRIEGLTKLYGASILITDKTRSKLTYDQGFSIRIVDRVKVKGRHEPVEIFEVFDGDATELREGKQLSLSMWQTGQSLYVSGDVQGAADAFQACKALCPGDIAAQLYLERCQAALSQNRRASWDAVTVMEHK